MTDLSLTVQRTINAPQDKVFNAWLDPETLARFMLPGPGMTVPRARSDAKTGGTFEIVMQGDGDEMPHSGEYLEISPHDRIVFTWQSPFSVEESEVTLEFAPDGAGTRVTLTHVRFADEVSRDNHEAGWTAILSALDGLMG